MIKKLVLFMVGAGLSALVVWTGLKSSRQDARWLVAFGLTCALLAPVAIEVFKFQRSARSKSVPISNLALQMHSYER